MTVEKTPDSEEKPEKSQLRTSDSVKGQAIHQPSQNLEYEEASQAGRDFTSMTELKVPTSADLDAFGFGNKTSLEQAPQSRTQMSAFSIEMEDGSTVTARSRGSTGDHQAPPPGSAEDTGTVIDYQWKKTGEGAFALGMNYEMGYEENAVDTRTPSEKMGDFLRAAAARATDPEVWQRYFDGQVEKFIGIGEGLNMAKEYTKEAVVAGWTALTDGTVSNFLSKPNAINDPLFKAVGGALDAMAQDPNAVNHALERLGIMVMQASEHYSSLPDREKGHVIGETAFFMINPEGSTEAGEAALKIAEKVATGVDKAVMDGIRVTARSVEEIAIATPELADQARRMLYDYTRKLGLSPQEMEAAGIPRGYFDGIEPPPGAGKGDNVYAMSKADDLGGDILKGGRYRVDKVSGRLQRTDLGKLREQYNWPVINERFSNEVLRQSLDESCVSAVGEMLSEGRVSEKTLIKNLGTPADIEELAKELGEGWTSKTRQFKSLSEIGEHGPWAAQLGDFEWTRFPKRPHAVIVEGVDKSGNVLIKDPLEGTRYEMIEQDFLKAWTRHAVYRTGG